MPRVTFIESSGRAHDVAAREGLSLMRAAVDNDVPGIDADCEGSCACATCQVFVDEAWRERVGAPNEQERSMLAFAASARLESRLACQIPVTAALEGLVVRLPEAQH